MRGITHNIGKNTLLELSRSDLDSVRRVLICRPNNRLGNQLLVTPLVQEVENIFPNCTIDMFVRGGASTVLFENYDKVDRLIQLPKKPFKELFKYLKMWYDLRKFHYDLVINVDNDSSSGRLSTKFSRSRLKFFSDTVDELKNKYDDYSHIAKFPVYNLRHLLSQNIDKEIPLLDIRLSEAELTEGKKVLDNIVDKNKKTIAIYTFATGDKCYTEAWWQPVYDLLTTKYTSEYNIMEVLPIENVSQIGFKAPSYYSKDLREITSVVANCEIFVGADSGMMHLASAAKIPVVGLFSVTKIEKYTPYGNGSVAVDTNKVTPEQLMEQIDTVLNRRKNKLNSLA